IMARIDAVVAERRASTRLRPGDPTPDFRGAAITEVQRELLAGVRQLAPQPRARLEAARPLVDRVRQAARRRAVAGAVFSAGDRHLPDADRDARDGPPRGAGSRARRDAPRANHRIRRRRGMSTRPESFGGERILFADFIRAFVRVPNERTKALEALVCHHEQL